MKYRLMLFIFITVIMMAQQGCSQEALVSGKVNLEPGWRPRLYLVRPDVYSQLISSYEGTVVDSADISPDGRFRFPQRPWLREKGLYEIFIQPENGKYRNGIAGRPEEANYICLSLSPGSRTTLTARANDLNRSYRLLLASPENEMIARLRDSTLLDAFLDSTQAFLPACVALRLRAPANDFRDRPEFYLRILNRFRTLEPLHPWIPQMESLLDKSKIPVLQGEILPDFALPTPNGDTIRLRDVRAPLLLVDFWASWCAPCRQETTETIRPLYDAYHLKGFNVLGVSIDRGRDAWLSAIRKDGAVWPNVSDLLGDASPVRQSLRFEYIPNNYLLDASGKLVARNLHKEALRDFVRNFFEKR